MEPATQQRPAVGIGVILLDQQQRILIGKRKGCHAPYYSIPGGHLELGESFEQAAIREIKEETGISINAPKVISITNNLATFALEGYHSVSVILLATEYIGTAQLLEPNKCEGWLWVDPQQLPEPHFDASKSAVHCYLHQMPYLPTKAL